MFGQNLQQQAQGQPDPAQQQQQAPDPMAQVMQVLQTLSQKVDQLLILGQQDTKEDKTEAVIPGGGVQNA